MKKAIICFTRVPRPGQTKTRLLPLLRPEQCVELHLAFLRDLSSVYEQINADLFVAYTPDPDPSVLQNIFPKSRSFFPQQGDDLGEKMFHAIEQVLKKGYDACILTGSDLPLMKAEHLNSGFSALENADVTLGPTSDGGYYLVGMKKPCPEVFSKQEYGCSTVWNNTLAAVEKAGYSFAPTLTCDDVDTPDDLKKLWTIIQDTSSHSAKFLDLLRKDGVSLC